MKTMNRLLALTSPLRSTIPPTHTQTTSGGKVLFANIVAGEWRASVSQASLLSEVEKYASRKEGQESPVKTRASAERDAAEQSPKRYRSTTIGDFWDEAPQDEFLQEHHKGIDTNASAEKAGFRLSHNQSYVFEIKALRSYMPVIIDTDEFSLVNSYTFALLSKLAYATNDFNRDDGKTTDNQGAISTVISQLKRKERPAYSGDLQAKWLLEEIPYSRALSAQYYAEDDVGSEGYIIFNDELAIIGVRGTEPYFQSKKPPVDNTKFKIIKAASGMAAVIADKIESATDSPGMKDLIITDLDAAQIAPEEFGGTYVHRGFYQYTMALLSLMEKDLGLHKIKNFTVVAIV